jgi:hypothetical protein
MAIKDTVELGQSILNFVKNVAVTGLIVMVLIWPAQLATVLRGIGIQEFEFMGLKGKTALVDLEQQLRDQKSVSQELEHQLQSSAELLEQVRAGRARPAAPTAGKDTADAPRPGGGGASATGSTNATGTPPVPLPPSTGSGAAGTMSVPVPSWPDAGQLAGLDQSLTKSIDQAYRLIARSASTTQATQATLDTVAPAVAVAQNAIGRSGLWAIVFSADATEAAAAPEIDRVRRLNLGLPQLYLRQNWYRGTLTFPTQSDAQAHLAQVRGTFKDAYVVNVSTWCPAPAQKSPAVWDCKS